MIPLRIVNMLWPECSVSQHATAPHGTKVLTHLRVIKQWEGRRRYCHEVFSFLQQPDDFQ